MLWLIPASDTIRDCEDELTYQTKAAALLVKNHFVKLLLAGNEGIHLLISRNEILAD